MAIMQFSHWDTVALGTFCFLNLLITGLCLIKIRHLKSANQSLHSRIHHMEEDIKALHGTTNHMGDHLKAVKYHYRILKEQQEQLSLKEPSQQSYRNAIQQIRNGDSTTKIVETSGLSRGEVELLRLLNSKESANQPMSV